VNPANLTGSTSVAAQIAAHSKEADMLYTDRIKNLTDCYPQLSRVWIKTDDPRMPLKGVWINEAALRSGTEEHREASCDTQTAELAEDHLLLAA
jgi:hypothetical protein